MNKIYRLLASTGIGYLIGLGFGRPGLGLMVGAAFGFFAPVLTFFLSPLTTVFLVLFFIVVVPNPLIVLIGLTLLIPLVLSWGLFSPRTSGDGKQQWFDFFGRSNPNRLMVRLMAGLVQSTDQSSDRQVRAARSFIMKNNPGIQSQFLWKTFQEALDSSIDPEQVARELNDETDPQQRIFCLRVLAGIAAAESSFTDSEEEYLRSVGKNLGLDSSRVESILEEARSREGNQRGSRRWRTGRRSSRRRRQRGHSSRNGTSLRDAYRTLDLTPSASREEVKEAYQEKVKQYHPDRHRGEGEEAVEEAEEKMAEINQAYQTIQENWNNAPSG